MEADKMFEELGYKKYQINSGLTIAYIYEFADYIVFDMEKQTVKGYIWGDCGVQELAKTFNINELKAINKKVEELGWI